MVPLQCTSKHIKTNELSHCFIFSYFAVCSREGIILGTVRLLYTPNLSGAAVLLFLFKELTWLSSVLLTPLRTHRHSFCLGIPEGQSQRQELDLNLINVQHKQIRLCYFIPSMHTRYDQMHSTYEWSIGSIFLMRSVLLNVISESRVSLCTERQKPELSFLNVKQARSLSTFHTVL